ncbi:uncharacterized protein LOC110410367 [Herrania umbratica]|uniref:Uncharacterized protein LOC110410367 n=1 Tax=Herrania umbratica TaxID=108875 RepID=A0A6J0ZLK6_9ROSI|nr:uncharacterized protein LOC110410367 [Herrania umbratica]
MKESSPSRLRKNCPNPPRKLKLVCSFNGAFHPRPPSGKLRYTGGETRIISVDRNIGFLKLRAKIVDLCPNVMFSLKYQVAVADVDVHMGLVVIESDEDVKCMVEQYEKLESYGKRARLWVFVCSNGLEGHFYKGQVGDKVTKNVGNGGNGLRYGDDSLRKMVLKQQLLAKHSGGISGIQGVSGSSVNESGRGLESCGKNQKLDHPLIDLGSEERRVFLSEEDPCETNLLDCEMRNLGSQMCPLKPRDGNLRMENNCSMQFLPGQSGGALCNGLGVSGQPDAASQGLKQPNNSAVISMCNGFDAKHDLRNSEQGSLSNFNTENIMPWAANSNPVNTHLEPVYFNNQWAGSPHNIKAREAAWGSQNVFRNHKFSKNGISNQGTHPYYFQNHRSNLLGLRNHRIVKLDGRLSSGKFYLELKPNSNISEQGHFMRSCCSSLWKPWPGLPEPASLEVASMMNPGFSDPDFRYGNSNPKACHLAYYGAWAGVGSQFLFTNNDSNGPTAGINMMHAKQYLMVGPNHGLEVPYQTPFENCHAAPIFFEPIHCNLQSSRSAADSQDVSTNSALSNDMGYSNGTEFVCNTQLSDAEACKNVKSNYKDGDGTHNLQGEVASSVDLLCNLSLSSSKGVHPHAHSSHGSDNVSDSLITPQSKPLDLTDEVQIDEDPQAGQSSGNGSNPSPKNMDGLEKDHIQGEAMQHDLPSDLKIDEKKEANEGTKCSKVIGRISSGLTAFFTHLATRELQTIKSSDLEYIKELGAGAYGTVFYGKWKGSDVAIKRLKPSCFSEGSVEEERLVADFWREAYILGQLHHPNIVAFYGVVTDGPLTSLATVAEYMVNGSLKQVLRRKDRTIDRRKRLIIAMDAAFGMEYLHEKNIVHFDLKSHNFLVNMRDPHRPVCKIGDLGLSKIKQKTLISGGVRGTIPWMAPELLNTKNNLVTEKVDVYSFGIVMWELLTGEEPYADLHSEEIIAGIIKGTLRPKIPNWCDPAWRSLMERCWSIDHDSRPAFSEIAKELHNMSAAMKIK